MNIPNLKDKVAVVTGGSGVLCSQFCKVLAQAGCKVAIGGIDKVLGDNLEKEIREAGYEATSFIMNVMDKESIKNNFNRHTCFPLFARLWFFVRKDSDPL